MLIGSDVQIIYTHADCASY